MYIYRQICIMTMDRVPQYEFKPRVFRCGVSHLQVGFVVVWTSFGARGFTCAKVMVLLSRYP